MGIERGEFFKMNANPNKVLLPNDVRKLLNVDNKEIVELCKKTSVGPKKDSRGQIYFSVDEVKKLRNAKTSVVAEMNEKKKVADKPVWTEIEPGHFIMANKEELEKYNKMLGK